MSANVQLAIFCTPEHLFTMVSGGDVENREAPFDIEQVLPHVRLAYFAPSCTPSCNANTSKRIKRRFSEMLSLFVPSIVSLKVFGSAEDTSAQCLLNERFFVLASFFIRKERRWPLLCLLMFIRLKYSIEVLLFVTSFVASQNALEASIC